MSDTEITDQESANKKVPHPADIYVGRMLRFLRKIKKMGQDNLADLHKKAGFGELTFQQIQKYENGQNRISASRLWKFAKLLNIAPGYFFKGLEDFMATLDEQDKQSRESIEEKLSSFAPHLLWEDHDFELFIAYFNTDKEKRPEFEKLVEATLSMS